MPASLLRRSPVDDSPSLPVLNDHIVDCHRCPRLVAHRQDIGRIQRRAYRGETYWSRPVPGFGDPKARVLIIGLAPGAHGANRTGRMFTGDRSGEYLFRALWQAGFANQAESTERDDSLRLTDAYITAAIRCVPPDNKPDLEEIATCRRFLQAELHLLTRVKVIVVLGAIALSAYLAAVQDLGLIHTRTPFSFGHGALHRTHAGGPPVLCSYHPSQQNTSTRRLTAAMLEEIFCQARSLVGSAT